MRNLPKAVCAAALIFSAQASIGCDYPPKISMPDGSTAEKEEMLEGVRAIKKWQEDLIAYRVCIEEETEASKNAIETSDPIEEQVQISVLERQLLLKYNASVDDETKASAKFNEQIRVYKSKKKTK